MHAINSPAVTRRSFLAAAGIATLPQVLLTGCGPSRPPRLIVLLDDLSGSRRKMDRTNQQTTINNIVTSLKAAEEPAAADKLVVAAIGDAPLSEFAVINSSMITYVGRPDRSQQIAAQREKLSTMIGSIEPLAASRETRIFDALAGSAEVLAADPSRRPAVCIVSDMLEDSPIAKFAFAAPTEHTTRGILNRLKIQGLVPDLKGAEVYVTGGGGKDGAAYEAIKHFWQAYFVNAKGNLVSYTRAPLEFGPEAE